MPKTTDDLMQTASQALADMAYARCEALCLQALTHAYDDKDWIMVQRVLLPLQEARRQKRQAAIDGMIRLGVENRPNEVVPELVPPGGIGCLVLTNCCDAKGCDDIIEAAGESFEVLYADNAIDAERWVITSVRHAVYKAEVPAPPKAWHNRWLTGQTGVTPSPAHWFMLAIEALGNAAIETMPTGAASLDRFRYLNDALEAIGNHEILHQRLAGAARDLQREKP